MLKYVLLCKLDRRPLLMSDLQNRLSDLHILSVLIVGECILLRMYHK
jgi:hypothetical protein